MNTFYLVLTPDAAHHFKLQRRGHIEIYADDIADAYKVARKWFTSAVSPFQQYSLWDANQWAVAGSHRYTDGRQGRADLKSIDLTEGRRKLAQSRNNEGRK